MQEDDAGDVMLTLVDYNLKFHGPVAFATKKEATWQCHMDATWQATDVARATWHHCHMSTIDWAKNLTWTTHVTLTVMVV